MRTLSEVTASIVPTAPGKHFGRRALHSAASQHTSLVLFRHDQTGAMVSVSDDGDAVSAVWIPKAMVTIDPKDRGPFLVVVISRNLAAQHNLSEFSILDWDRYLPEERLQLKDAVECAQRARRRLSGQRTFSRCNGRDHYA